MGDVTQLTGKLSQIQLREPKCAPLSLGIAGALYMRLVISSDNGASIYLIRCVRGNTEWNKIAQNNSRLRPIMPSVAGFESHRCPNIKARKPNVHNDTPASVPYPGAVIRPKNSGLSIRTRFGVTSIAVFCFRRHGSAPLYDHRPLC